MLKVLFFFIGVLFSTFVFADDVTAQDLWLQSTADIRAAITETNNKTQAQEAAQLKADQQTALQAQQAAQQTGQNNQETKSPVPTNSVTGGTNNSNNPYLKPNPWQNTQNPYPGQQYQTTPTTTTKPSPTNSSTTTTVPTNNSTTSTPTNSPPNSTGTIYVIPKNQQPSQQNQNFNIYK